MSKKDLLKKFETYCEKEYTNIINEKNNGWGMKKHWTLQSLQRCLGTGFFLQELGVPFKDIDKIYSKYREKFYELL